MWIPRNVNTCLGWHVFQVTERSLKPKLSYKNTNDLLPVITRTPPVLPSITTLHIGTRFYVFKHRFSTYSHVVFKTAQWVNRTGITMFDRLRKLRPRAVRESLKTLKREGGRAAATSCSAVHVPGFHPYARSHLSLFH